VKNIRLPALSFGLAAIVVLIWPATALAATNPGLLTAGDFAVLAGTTITNTGPSWITGAIGAGAAGIAPGSFPPGTAGPQHVNDGVYTTAETDLTNAYANAVQPCTTDYSGVNLGGLTLVPGVYCQTTAPTLTGTLTLNGSGIYIFLIGTTAAPTTLVTANSASVVLINGAQPCQIFWRVTSSATIAPSTAFEGTIMANIGIQMQTGATLFGRALARTAAVTLDTNRIIQPAGCGNVGPAYVGPPVGNILPATLGVPSELLREIPWLLLIGVGGAAGAIALGASSARRRRRSI
jgi:type VI secretion system secreted protein VgrG